MTPARVFEQEVATVTNGTIESTAGVGRTGAKFDERRAQLAGSALRTLSELGYARTSLREIAQNSEFSHGVLHYYFRDKVDLILHSVRQYKAVCVTRYDEIVAAAESTDQLLRGFGAAMATTLQQDAHTHRLWYDLRSQSLFEPVLRPDVLELDMSLQLMIWRVVCRYADLAERPLRVTPEVAYALFDGLFQRFLLLELTGDPTASEQLESHVIRTLTDLVLG